MNYIAHLHLAHLTHTSLLGNFLGDFVKGSDLTHLSPEIATGIELHRKIDSFTDTNDEVSSLKNLFDGSTRRLAAASLDIYFDYLLMNSAARQDLEKCIEIFYQALESDQMEISTRYQRVRSNLLTHRWLSKYSEKETVLKALLSLESRLGNKITFAEASFVLMQKHHNQLESAFMHFYPKLISFAKNTVS